MAQRYLLLAGGLPLAVQLAELQVGEQPLDGRAAVAVRRGVHHWDLHLPEVLADLLAGVIRRVVDEDDRVIFPAGRLDIQLFDQVAHEDHEGVLVGGGVAEREVDPAFRIQGSNHGERRADWLRGDRRRRLGRAPHLPREVGLVQPGLVDVDDPAA